jgi:CelD/BcsL family acetyltransferase involved in cellulose biosynthesis
VRSEEFNSVDDLRSLVPEWDALVRQIPSASIFSTWEWLGCWYTAYGGGSDLRVVAFRQDGNLVGLAPLMVQAAEVAPRARLRFLRLLGDGSEDSDNLDILALPGYEGQVAEAFRDYLRSSRDRWDVAELNTTPMDSTVVSELVVLLKEDLCPMQTKSIPCTVVPLPDTWNDYLSQISSKERGKIGYYHRRVQSKYESKFDRCEGSEDLPEFLKTLYELHEKRWSKRTDPGSFQDERRRYFYEMMSREFLRQGWLEFWRLELNGRAVATQFGFRLKNRIYALQEGFDPEYSADSVGFILRAYVLERAIESGAKYYDFLGGVNDSKLRWGGTVSSYINLSFALPRTRGSMYLACRQAADDGKRWLRSHISPELRKKIRGLLQKP